MPQKSRSINLKNLTVGSDNSASTKIQKGDDQTGSESSITKKTIFSNIHSKNIFRKINNSQKKTSLLNDQRSVPNTTNKKDKNYGTAKSSPGISSIFKLYNEQMTQINTSRPQIPAITRPVVNSNYKMSDATCLTNLKHMCVMKDPIVEMTKNGANLTPQISASSIPVTTNNENKNNQPSSMELTPNLRLYHTISYSNRSEKFGMIQLPLHVQQNLKSVVDELLVFRLGSSHPNNVLLQMRDCYFHENSVYFITEYVVYEHNLQKWSESSKIMHTNSQLSLVIAECFKSLVFIYQKLIIHRQIRASNFVINHNGRIKLCNFSQAQILSSCSDRISKQIGQVHWMAPEMLSGDLYDQRCDVWSMGITFVEIYNQAKPPYHSLSPIIAAWNILERKTMPHIENYDKFPNDLKTILELMLQFNAEKRPYAVDSSLIESKLFKPLKEVNANFDAIYNHFNKS